MVYQPKRTAYFEHASDVIHHVEAAQCCTCLHREAEEEMPMCNPIALAITLEKVVEDLEEVTPGRVVCHKYEGGA